MKKEERINQIVESMDAFSNEEYLKKDLLNEYYKLERQVVETTFNKEHVEEGNLTLKNVYQHFQSLCNQYGNKLTEEFRSFSDLNYAVVNGIRKITSGDWGEAKAYKSLATLKCKNKVVRNLELAKDDHKAEIDLIVITQKAVFVIEVKNTKRDIRIDENGNYIKVGKNEFIDCVIGEKMNEREYLVRNYLEENGINNPNIISLLVFTNSSIKVENNYNYITHCFLGSMPHIIQNYDGKIIYNLKEIEKMYDLLNKKEAVATFKPDCDIQAYKRAFANLLASVEMLSYKKEIITEKTNNSFFIKVKDFFENRKYAKELVIGTLVLTGGFLATRLINKAKR